MMNSHDLKPKYEGADIHFPFFVSSEVVCDFRPHSAFEASLLDELPGAPVMPVFHYPGAADSGRDGLMVKVKPRNGDRWIGVFAFGGRGGMNAVFSCPNPNQLCVIAMGKGYLVEADSPAKWSFLPVELYTGIHSAFFSAKHNILVFGDEFAVHAWGETGLKWTTGRISMDGLAFTGGSDDCLMGVAFDPCSEKNVAFRVNLADGSHAR